MREKAREREGDRERKKGSAKARTEYSGIHSGCLVAYVQYLVMYLVCRTYVHVHLAHCYV